MFNKLLFFYLLLGFVLFSCKENTKDHNVNRAFYYWKSKFSIDSSSTHSLEKLNVQTLYIKYFDVVWDAYDQLPKPVATVRFQTPPPSCEIIPTIFITNETMLNMQSSEMDALAEKMLQLIKSVTKNNGFDKIRQIQIDCDWNAASKEKYFKLLSTLQESDSDHIYSATIRLHQLKYADKTGVPPVSRGLLMCYNMGNIKSPRTANSILDPEEMQKYTSGYLDYALPLDYAFPLFSWTVLFRNHQYAGLLQNLTENEISNIAKKVKPNVYEVIENTNVNGYSFLKNDVLRFEDSKVEDILAASKLLYPKLQEDSFSVVLYHLDPLMFKTYSDHELETIFNSLR